MEYYEECANSLNTFKATDTEPREQKKNEIENCTALARVN